MREIRRWGEKAAAYLALEFGEGTAAPRVEGRPLIRPISAWLIRDWLPENPRGPGVAALIKRQVLGVITGLKMDCSLREAVGEEDYRVFILTIINYHS